MTIRINYISRAPSDRNTIYFDDVSFVELPSTGTATPTPTPSPTPTATITATPTTTGAPTPSLFGHVTLYGHGLAGNESWRTQLAVSVFQPGTGHLPSRSALFSQQVQTDSQGHFSVGALPLQPGSYDLSAKGSHTLGNLRQYVYLAAGANNVDFGTLLEGDVYQDNLVDISDLSVLAWRFGRAVGQEGYDPRADLNQDGVIDILDVALLAGNFGMRGDRVVQ